jgi:serine/threonine protein kinase
VELPREEDEFVTDGGTIIERAPAGAPLTGSLSSGTTFAGYLIEGVAGRGGMGVVYRARESRPARTVALKVISPELAADAEFRARFERESDIAATIEHSNVVPVHRVGEEDGLLFLVMRFVEGTDLAAMIAGGRRLEPRRAVHIVAQVCAALDAAHGRGLVHRDVKPANVLIAREGDDHVYLTDFGIAKRSDTTTAGPTVTGHFLGTLDYVSPEQIESGNVDARTDIYAVGCILYQALAGRVPFRGDSPAATIWAHLSSEAPSLLSIDPRLPAGMDAVVRRALAKDPNDRFPTAGDLARAAGAALEQWQADIDAHVTPPSASDDAQSTVRVDVRAVVAPVVSGGAPATPAAPASAAVRSVPPPPATPAPTGSRRRLAMAWAVAAALIITVAVAAVVGLEFNLTVAGIVLAAAGIALAISTLR